MTKIALIKIYRNLKLRTKIFLWFFTIIFITTFSICIFSFNLSYKYALDNEAEKQILILRSIQENTNQVLQRLQYAAISLSCDKNVIKALSSSDENDYEKTSYNFIKTFYSQTVLENTNDVCIISSNDSIFTSIKEKDITDKLFEQYQSNIIYLKQNVIGITGQPVIKQSGSAVLPYFRQIKDYRTNEYLGSVVVYVNENTISDLYKSVTETNTLVMMLDEENNVLASSEDTYINSLFTSIANTSNLENGKEYFRASLNNEDYFCVKSIDSISGYTYISLMPMKIVMRTPNAILAISLIIIVIAFILAIFVSLAFSNTIARPLSNLVNVMDQTHNMQEIHSLHYKYNDEIGKLIKSFASMSERLNSSLSAVIEEQEKRRLAEFNALKWQINPHFLYNTLSSIVWLSEKKEHQKVIEVTRALTILLKIGLNKDNELILIKDEMEHVKSYLDIQMLRYKNQFKYVFDVEPDCLNLYTVKIIVQPLVENAIYHGVRDRINGGIVKVCCKQYEDKVIIDVMDNGENMTKEHAQELNDFISGHSKYSNEEFGIGIKNVHDRISYYFKGDFGLQFIRNTKFTIARIEIPVVSNIEKLNR